MRKSSGGKRAWFLEEESEPRNKQIFLAEIRRKISGLTYQLARLFLHHGFGNAYSNAALFDFGKGLCYRLKHLMQLGESHEIHQILFGPRYIIAALFDLWLQKHTTKSG
jgi:hypothetical protein